LVAGVRRLPPVGSRRQRRAGRLAGPSAGCRRLVEVRPARAAPGLRARSCPARQAESAGFGPEAAHWASPLGLALRPRAGRHAADRLDAACLDVPRDAPRARDRRLEASTSVARLLGALRDARAQRAVVRLAAVAWPAWGREAEERALRPEAAEVQPVLRPEAVVVPRAAALEALRVLVARAAELRAWQQGAEVMEGRRAAAVQTAPQVLLEAAHPSAAASVCRRDRVLPWPVPQRRARFARATRSLQIASL